MIEPIKAFICGLALCLSPFTEEPVSTANPPEPETVELLALTMWGEARGEGVDGMRAVGHVVMNRCDDGRSVEEVVLQPYQFSIYNGGRRPRPERASGLDAQRWDEALEIAENILEGEDADITRGADHYHATYVAPRWSRHMERVARIGRHVFYRA